MTEMLGCWGIGVVYYFERLQFVFYFFILNYMFRQFQVLVELSFFFIKFVISGWDFFCMYIVFYKRIRFGFSCFGIYGYYKLFDVILQENVQLIRFCFKFVWNNMNISFVF